MSYYKILASYNGYEFVEHPEMGYTTFIPLNSDCTQQAQKWLLTKSIAYDKFCKIAGIERVVKAVTVTEKAREYRRKLDREKYQKLPSLRDIQRVINGVIGLDGHEPMDFKEIRCTLLYKDNGGAYCRLLEYINHDNN